MSERRFGKSFLVTFVSMFVFWIILSNIFDLIHLSLGVFCSLLVAYVSHDLLITREKISTIPREIFGFVKYFVWLVKEIIVANIDVAKIVLDPKLPISPRIIKYESELESDLSKTTYANSITLTPGTLTVDVDEESNYFVHCLAKHHADGLKDGEMERRIQEVYGEGEAQ